MGATPPQSFSTKPLSEWERKTFLKELRKAIRELKEVFRYAIFPRVARPEHPLDPPSGPAVSEETLAQCKEIYEQLETRHEYLDEKARSTFGVIAFLAPLLIAAVTYLLSHSSASASLRVAAIGLGIIAFVLLVLGFASTVRALAVQGREILFLNAVIDPDPSTPTLRPYDRTRHARGLLYCASINEAYNTHIAQCVKSAHVLTALAVIIASLSAIPGLIALANQKDDITKTEIVSPITLKKDGTPLGDSLLQIRDELKANGLTASQISAMNARLDKLEAAMELAASTKRTVHKPIGSSGCK